MATSNVNRTNDHKAPAVLRNNRRAAVRALERDMATAIDEAHGRIASEWIGRFAAANPSGQCTAWQKTFDRLWRLAS